MQNNDILNLAKLSRLHIDESELDSYRKDFEGVLGYIDSISKIDVPFADHYATNLSSNKMREDDESYLAGEFTKDILDESPDQDGGFIKVKKVL